ncbi:hypothetical protein SDC9_140420 [bioreactor metagenome]|uniref:Type I restriction enzyme R protein N-terminal domain-containing protein n=1 Tax=bioreactor metagenome TaxID=1076179 RepID=A0A645DUU4_9ZZZZ
MWQLNLPEYKFKIKKTADKLFILDSLRKKFVKLTPEEWVRQNFIQFLIINKHFPAALIALESQIEVNGMKKRCDAIIYNKSAEPIIIIEFKAPTVTISQSTFDQAAVYNSKLHIDYFIISNGIQHFFCQLNHDKMNYDFLVDIPDFDFFIRSQ